MRGCTDVGTHRLLIVDDEALILRALSRALGGEYEVTTLASPDEALRRITSGEAWGLVLSDVMMPEMNGIEFARRAVGACPALAGHIILMTGGAPTSQSLGAMERGGVPLVAKPIDLAALRSLLARVRAKEPWTAPPDPA